MTAPNKRPIAKKSRNSNIVMSTIKVIVLLALAIGFLFFNNDWNRVKDHDGNPSARSQAAKSDADYLREKDENSINSDSTKYDIPAKNNEDLLTAAIYGDTERVSALLDQQADINTVNETGDTPLINATIHNHKSIVDLLIKRQANVNMSNKVGNSALLEAAAIGNDEIVKSLMTGGADLQIKNIAGQTALEVAQQYGHKKIVKLLRGQAPAQPKPGLINSIALTANSRNLHLAVKQGDIEGIRSLISSGVDVNVRDAQGRIALIIATKKGDIQIVRLLLKSGADPNVKDSLGETAILNAQRLGLVQIGQLLKQAGAKTPLYNQIVTNPKQ